MPPTQARQVAQVGRLMKITKRGKPFVKDTHDLFATLMVSLKFESNRQFFKTFHNSFTTDAASSNLSSLKFSQSTRSPDPKDENRVVTTTTTTTFSMSREMAKSICQHFMDAHLIANAADSDSSHFKDRGVYVITPKGLHILERFISKNGISADHLMKVFAAQAITMKLLHLERRTTDDEILINKSVIEVLFRRFAGRHPNLSKMSEEQFQTSLAMGETQHHNRCSTSLTDEIDLALGVAVRLHASSQSGQENAIPDLVFPAASGITWLIDYTTIVCVDEAAEVAAHFVRYGLIKLVQDKASKFVESTKVAVAKGGARAAGGGPEATVQESEFRYGDKVLYNITLEGSICARWDASARNKQIHLNAATLESVSSRSSIEGSERKTSSLPVENPTHNLAATTDHKLIRRSSITDQLRMDYLELGRETGSLAGQIHIEPQGTVKDSHTAKLRQILEEPVLRSLFREFLRSNICEENLSFWLDCQDFKRRFNMTSSAHSVELPGSKGKPGMAAMEKHQQDIVAMAFLIYNSYLAPSSPSEINIDHNLREGLLSYMSKIAADVKAKEGITGNSTHLLDPAVAARALHASQVRTIVKLYERIQGYIFRLMATDSVPKFVQTERYITIMKTVSHLDDPEPPAHLVHSSGGSKTNPSFSHGTGNGNSANKEDLHRVESDPGVSVSRAYVTISQAANEKHAALRKQQQ